MRGGGNKQLPVGPAIPLGREGQAPSCLGWLSLSHFWQPPDLLSVWSDDVPGMGADFEVPVSSAWLKTQWPGCCLGVSNGNDLKVPLDNMHLHLPD